MKKFLDQDFLLQSDSAKVLYHSYAEKMPVFDFHNHLSPKMIYENKPLGNLANAWLDFDHYKWRAMRQTGVPEDVITGHLNKDGTVKTVEERGGEQAVEKADYERYLSFVKTLEKCIGNPLYHWSHLELKRYFGVDDYLTQDNAKAIWDKCNELLQKDDFTPRGLIKHSNVHSLCTTDDPCDSLEFHKKLALEWNSCKVLPSFRPDNAVSADVPSFAGYVSKLQEITGITIKNIDDLIKALSNRIDYFKSAGCVVSDHSLEADFYLPSNYEDANAAFLNALNGYSLSKEEICLYKTYLLTALGKLYAQKGLVMQLHIGALRDNNSQLFNSIGKNVGTDSLNDFNYITELAHLLDDIYKTCGKDNPRIILYNLNPKDNEALACMAANFRNCVFGPAWWFNDHKDGIEEQLRIFSRTSVLGTNIGMLTDSRSFLSFPRHEYYRRILCNYVGALVENGEYPWNEKLLGKMIEDISYNNAEKFFGDQK